MLGAVDTVSQDSPGESGNVYAAFANAILVGGCPYNLFTPEACNAAFPASMSLINSGAVVVNPNSFHAAGETQKYPYLIDPTYPNTMAIDSYQATQMVAGLAAKAGISPGTFIAPSLIVPTAQTKEVIPDIIKLATPGYIDKNVPVVIATSTQPNTTAVTNTTNVPVVTAATDWLTTITDWFSGSMVAGIPNEYLAIGGVVAVGAMMALGGAHKRGRF